MRLQQLNLLRLNTNINLSLYDFISISQSQQENIFIKYIFQTISTFQKKYGEKQKLISI